MDSWISETTSPDIKFEASPAESFISMPGEAYPSLFGSSSSSTLNPLDIMTPKSFTDEKHIDLSALSGLAADDESAPSTPTTASEKKQSKKRKSWGQVLPEPKTNLPPRKRAKTDDEKEQRRVERVLRNRRAAQSSRERKRLEVEALEKKNAELERRLRAAESQNMLLLQELRKTNNSSGMIVRNPVTFSQELFSSQDGHTLLAEKTNTSVNELMMDSTINPTSLSPALSPITEEDLPETDETEADVTLIAEATKEETFPDSTQHSAAVLCDLPCQSAKASPSWLAFQQPPSPALALYWQLTMVMTCTSALLSMCTRPLTQIAMSMKAGFSLHPNPALLNTIIWLVTTPSSRRRTSTSTSSSTTKQTSRPAATSSAASLSTRFPTTLRLKLLRKILTSSPILARPLTDATMVALRLVRSEEMLGVDRVVVEDGSSAKPPTRTAVPDGGWPNGATLPSKEVLLTLLWAIQVEERRILIKNQTREGSTVSSRPGRSSSALKTPLSAPMISPSNQKFILKTKRRRGEVEETHQVLASVKRRRSG